MQEGQLLYSHQKMTASKGQGKKAHFYSECKLIQIGPLACSLPPFTPGDIWQVAWTPCKVPSLESFICSFRRTKGVPHGRRNQQCQNANSLTNACLRLFLVAFYPQIAIFGYRMAVVLEQLRAGEINGQQGRTAGLNRSLQQNHTLKRKWKSRCLSY